MKLFLKKNKGIKKELKEFYNTVDEVDPEISFSILLFK